MCVWGRLGYTNSVESLTGCFVTHIYNSIQVAFYETEKDWGIGYSKSFDDE